MKHSIVISALISSALLAGCSSSEPDEYDVKEYEATTSPASLYCVQQGGNLEMVSEDKKRVTYCVLSEDEKYEQWEYYENRQEKDKQ
ncbi:putative hemolysin [Vibrio sp. C8]